MAYVYSSASGFISKIDKEPFCLVMTVKICGMEIASTTLVKDYFRSFGSFNKKTR
jgi:hypothetical protein